MNTETRRHLRRSLACLTIATGLIAAIAAPAGAAAAPAAPACVDYLPVADNTALGNTFVRGGYKFQALGGLTAMVNVTIDILGNDVHGVQFMDTGIRVATPSPADTVDVTMGVFHTPFVLIRAYDAAGALVDSAQVPADYIEHTVTLDGAQDITRLRMTGGGNEAIIEEICAQ